ncbi:MAG: right-handed parallel beta-helix repeat-containing protein [Candidatus Thorarchaeota archaeon]
MIVLALVLCLSATTSNETALSSDQTEISLEKSHDDIDFDLYDSYTKSYTPHDIIDIDNNSAFVTYGFPGYGNSTHPYLIEGYEIEPESFEIAISISDTNASFVISNCSIHSLNSDAYGLSLSNVSNARVENCEFKYIEMGMFYHESRNITIFNCTFWMLENIGLATGSANNTITANCTFFGCENGIWVGEDDQVFTNNTFLINDIGINIDNCDNITAVNNEFLGDGIEVYGGAPTNYIHNLTGNTLNGKPIFYDHSKNGNTVTGDYGQIIIANCTNTLIKDHNMSLAYYGLQVYTSEFVTIENVNVTEAEYGIIVSRTSNVTIDSCNASACWRDGILLEEADNATIVDCISHDNSHAGLSIFSSDFVNITSNDLRNNGNFGIDTGGVNYTITGNYFENNGDVEIELGGNSTVSQNTINGTVAGKINIQGKDCTIIDNTIYFSSFDFQTSSLDYMRHTFSGNTINGNPVLYYYNETGLVIDGLSVGQLILAGVNSSMISNLAFSNISRPILMVTCNDIEIESVTGLDVGTGIRVLYSNRMVIDDVEFEKLDTLESGGMGIFLGGSSDCFVNDTRISGFEDGVWIEVPDNITVADSHFESNDEGIYSLNSVNGSIIRNTFHDSVNGIRILATGEKYGCNIENNTITESYVGIEINVGIRNNISNNVIRDYTYGMQLGSIINVTIKNNNITFGEQHGIRIEAGADSNITGNHIYWNYDTGIFVEEGSSFNFINNSLGGNLRNAYDGGTSNNWDDGSMWGNLWSDYNGTGTYSILGSAGSIDNYPRQVEDNDPPEISSPEDVVYEILTTTVYVTWSVSDMSLDSYRIMRNGTQVHEDAVSDWDIQYNVGGLDGGVYNYTIVVNDTRGNDASDTVFVTVLYSEGFIHISNNTDFLTYGFPGSGTELDPYRIENRTIIGDSHCILIHDTDAFFIIRNCTLGSLTTVSGVGIRFMNVTNGIVENCTISQKHHGIYLDQSRYHSFINNTISRGYMGIELESSENITIIDNSIVDNVHPDLKYNYLTGGIGLTFTPNCTIDGNFLRNNSRYGLYEYSSHNMVVRNNVFEKCGIAPQGLGIAVSNNTVNGKPLGHWYNQTNLVIDPDDYGQVIVANCTKVEIRDGEVYDATVGILLFLVNNATVYNVTSGLNTLAGFYSYVSYNVTIENCTAYGSYSGAILSVGNGNIYNSTFACNYYSGIITQISECEVRDNEIYGNLEYGIMADGLNTYIYNNLIAWNLVSNGYTGSFGIANFDDDNSTGNIWNDYVGSGIYPVPLYGVDNYPRSISDTTAPTINSENGFSYELGTTAPTLEWTPDDRYPGWYDILVNGTLVKNGTWFAQSILYTPALSSAGVFNMTVVARDAAGNTVKDTVIVTVTDSGPPEWVVLPEDQYFEYNTTFSYTVYATDLDRIASYSINDTAHFSISETGVITNITYLDLGVYAVQVFAYDPSGNSINATFCIHVIDTLTPTIESPADYQYEVGTGGHTLTWLPNDVHPSNWTLLVNGSVERTGLWDGGSITISIDGLGVGVYNFTILVSDAGGNVVSDTVYVTVTESTTATTTTTTTTDTTLTTPPVQPPDILTLVIVLSAGVGVAAIVIILVLRRGTKGYEP